MTPVDVDYNGYVIAAYGVAIVALLVLLGWSMSRVIAARKRLSEAEKEDAQ
jgi:heme exporter protein CcmD